MGTGVRPTTMKATKPIGRRRVTLDEALADVDSYRASASSVGDDAGQTDPLGTQPAPAGGGNDPLSPKVTSVDDHLVLHDIKCYDADGAVFEEYDQIKVAKDVARKADGSHKAFTPYEAIAYFEGQGNGHFLPSFALSCNILVALYKKAVRKESDGTYTTLDSEAKKVLDQYKDHGAGWGWHAQNTIVDYKAQHIIDYPIDADFPNAGNNVNQSQRTRAARSFVKKQKKIGRTITLTGGKLEDVLSNPLTEHFVKQYTGLQDPNILIEMGNYFGKPARVWFPDNVTTFKDKRAAWLGCDGGNFGLDADYNLNYNDAARGVQRTP